MREPTLRGKRSLKATSVLAWYLMEMYHASLVPDKQIAANLESRKAMDKVSCSEMCT
jgi:hypothetical protein